MLRTPSAPRQRRGRSADRRHRDWPARCRAEDADRQRRLMALGHLQSALGERQAAEPVRDIRQPLARAEQQQHVAGLDLELRTRSLKRWPWRETPSSARPGGTAAERQRGPPSIARLAAPPPRSRQVLLGRPLSRPARILRPRAAHDLVDRRPDWPAGPGCRRPDLARRAIPGSRLPRRTSPMTTASCSPRRRPDHDASADGWRSLGTCSSAT